MATSAASRIARSRAVRATSVTALIAGSLAIAPAAGAASLTANDADSFVAALATAAASSSADTITITADFTIPEDADTRYEGASALTINGVDNTVTGSGDETGGSVFLYVGEDAGKVTVSHLTIKNFTYMGAVVSLNQDLTISTVVFRDNSTSDDFSEAVVGLGSAISSNGGVTVEDVDFVDNTGGAGVFTDQAGVLFADGSFPYDAPPSRFENVGVDDNVGVLTGGIFAVGTMTLHGGGFSGNSGYIAGAIYAGGTGTEIEHADFSRNSSSAPEGVGAVFVNADTRIDTASFYGNTSPDGVGAILVGPTLGGEPDAGALFELGDAQFNLNEGDLAGAVAVLGSSTILNSTFSENSSGEGPIVALGIDDNGADSTIVDSTFDRNTASGEDGAVVAASLTDADQSLTIAASTFTGNADATLGNLAVDQELGAVTLYGNAFDATSTVACTLDLEDPEAVSVQYNFDADGTCTNDWDGHGNFGDGVDPMFGAYEAGQEWTFSVELLAGSPLIDVIPLTECFKEFDTRIRPAGAGCDVGAFEYVAVAKDRAFEIQTANGVIHGVAHDVVSVDEISWSAELDGTPPADTAFPFGLSSFTIHTQYPGERVKITLTLPRPVNQLWKVSGGEWERIDARFSGNTVTYKVQDGGLLDEDGEVNATIVDPVAAAIGASFTG